MRGRGNKTTPPLRFFCPAPLVSRESRLINRDVRLAPYSSSTDNITHG